MEIGRVKPIKIEDEVSTSYLAYAMSVIVSRSLPDVRDGLKPVQRRILYAMNDMGLRHTSSFKKSARIVGEVMGKYHPHGDASIYETLVRLAQDFSMRYPLVKGQGNFGSVDNDPPAAMRYTEAKLMDIAQETLVDIEKETVDFVSNFDDSLKEPSVLPSRIPNLLINGSAGIAVGVATNIPPHNLTEICDAICYLVDSPEATIDDLMALVRGPDFPTGGIICGKEGVRKAFASGRGKVIVRAKLEIEEVVKERRRIVITELPYQTNKAELVARIAELAKEGKLWGISELRDESDRHGMRIVIELRKGAEPQVVVNNLYKHTALQSAFFVNMLALIDGEPRVINLREALQTFIDFRYQIITRRFQFELRKARERAHVLEGLKIALEQLDLVISIIRQSSNAEAACNELMQTLVLSRIQTQAIIDMQLRRLASLERQKILDEYVEVLKNIVYLENMLADPIKIRYVIKEEIQGCRTKYGDPRRTEIMEEELREVTDESLIPHQRMVVTMGSRGYIKRVNIDSYRLQHRGGKGLTGVTLKETESAHIFLIADTHDSILLFTNKGKVYVLKCHAIPQEFTRTSRGVPLTNLISITEQEKVTAVIRVSEFEPSLSLILATRYGSVKKIMLQKIAFARSNGLIIMNLAEGDELISAKVASSGDSVIVVSCEGKAIRFSVDILRTASRTSGGVRGIKLDKDNFLVGMDVIIPDSYLLTITEGGYGKLTKVRLFTNQNRGGRGVIAHRLLNKSGKLIASRVVDLSMELMLLSTQGIVIRLPVRNISVQGRGARGVGVMHLNRNDTVTNVSCIPAEGLSDTSDGD